MKIAIGCDHAGFKLKEKIKACLLKDGHTLEDYGTYNLESCDYPEYASRVARAVRLKRCKRGILICATGIGMSMAANKIPGIRAGLCHNPEGARLSRQHNDANVLVLGATFTKPALAVRISRVWLKTKFAGGRHARRLKKIIGIESTVMVKLLEK